MVTIIHPRPRFGRRASGAPTYRRGKKYPAWALVAVPFYLVMGIMVRLVRSNIHWMAVLLTVLIFEAVLLPVEHAAILRGNWVWNESRILGPLFWGIPIEEPLIYFCMPVVFVIAVFELATGHASGTLKVRFPWRKKR